MENHSTWTLVILVALAIFYLVFSQLYRKNRQNRWMAELQFLEFEQFDKDIRSPIVRLFFPLYQIEFLKLNRYLLSDDSEKIQKQFQIVSKLARKKEQRQEVCTIAFEHYVYEENKEECDRYLKEIDSFDNSTLQAHAHQLYDILIEHKTDNLPTMEQSFQKASPGEKTILAYLLAKQYRFLDQEKKAQYYESYLKKETSA